MSEEDRARAMEVSRSSNSLRYPAIGELISRGLRDLLEPQYRTLRIPPGPYIGSLSVRDASTGVTDWTNPRWTYIGDACGDVRIPVGYEVWLDVHYPRVRTDSLTPEEEAALIQRADVRMSYDADGYSVYVVPPSQRVDIRSFKNGDLDYLSFGDSGIDDGDFEAIKALTDLKGLRLTFLDLAGDCLSALVSLRRIKDLDLGLSNFTDEALANIRGLCTLRRLGRVRRMVVALPEG